ncbi:peptide chain release factor N(5)-glutamine methyltransferase [Variovorax sp. PvP013]|uniref:peptide chain release factor N(5)-glutamine methyltransferase n=1 Tax=Variovorax sp. PvP013 TaxID=3156435 RepID=UPI003D1D7FA9
MSAATLAQALRAAAAAGLDRLDAQLLLLHALGRPAHDRAWLLAHDDDALPDAVRVRFDAHAARRAAGEPVAYLVGEKEFHGLALRVDTRVLVPRPDTETLVEWALAVLPPARPARSADALVDAAETTGAAGAAAALHEAAAPSVLDLGTGSGAIALALQRARPDLRVEAVDASAEALEVARDNAARLGLPVRFRQADWLDGTPAGACDLIVSNPPYIAAGDPHLPALAHEPASALVAGADGLDDLRRIVAAAPSHLRTGGWLLLEHGHDQAAAVRALLAAHGFIDVASREDLAGIERCSGGRRAAPSGLPTGEDLGPATGAAAATVK